MARQCEILLIEDQSAASGLSLAPRLHGLGFRTTQVHHTDELTGLLDRPDSSFQAALLSTGLPWESLWGFATSLGPHLASGELTGLAVGEVPVPAIRERLREAGFTLALWHPFNDRTLRFQVNRAFLRARGEGPARGELRAPLAWRASIQVAGRRKEAQVYNLSERGAFLETPRPSIVGTKIDVQLQLPRGPRSLPCKVLHTNVTGNLLRPHAPIGMGIRFEDPSPALCDDLAQIVAERNLELLA